MDLAKNRIKQEQEKQAQCEAEIAVYQVRQFDKTFTFNVLSLLTSNEM